MAGFWRSPKREHLLRALDTVRGPDGKGLVLAGLVESATLSRDGEALVTLAIDPADATAATGWQAEATAALQGIKGVKKATVVLTAHAAAGRAAAAPPSPALSATAGPDAAEAGTVRVRKGARLSDAALAQGAAAAPARPAPLAGIGALVAVASAKGGVGKSSVAVNLARALADTGLRVGLLDIDIYGPSLPTLLGTRDAEPATGADRKLVPVEAWGLKTMSIGYMVDPDAPMIWRGPIVTSAIRQMLNDVSWAPLDVLVLDTPPGTGEAQLALAQSVPLTAAILVTTPQEVALADVRRGAAMFAKTHVPVLGIVENMAWLDLPDGSRLYPFGDGGGVRMAQALGLPVLAQLPMDQALREAGDAGMPVLDAQPASASAAVLRDLAAAVLAGLAGRAERPAPTIRFVD